MADWSPEALAALGMSEPKKSSSLKRGAGQVLAEAGQTAVDITGGAIGKGMLESGQALARENPAEVTEPGQIAEKPGTFVKETIGEQLPRMVLPVLGGVGGAMLGGPPGAAAGFLAGSALPSLVAEYGGIRQEQLADGKVDDKGRALGYGAAAAGLDVATGVVPVLGKLGGALIKKGAGAAFKGGLKETGKAAAKTAAKEGATEGVQTGLERQGAAQELTGPEASTDYVMSALKGATAGGAVGGGAHAVQGLFTPDSRAAIKTDIEVQKADIMRHMQLEPGVSASVNVSNLDMETGDVQPGESAMDIGAGKTPVDIEAAKGRTPVEMDVTGQQKTPVDIPLAPSATPLDMNLAQQQPLAIDVGEPGTSVDIATGKPRTAVDIRTGTPSKRVNMNVGEPGTTPAVDVGTPPSFKGLPPKLIKDLSGKTPEQQGQVLLDKFNAIGREAAKNLYAEKIPPLYKQITGKEIPDEQVQAQGAGSAAPVQGGQGAQPAPRPRQPKAGVAGGVREKAQPAQAGLAPQQEAVAPAPVAKKAAVVAKKATAAPKEVANVPQAPEAAKAPEAAQAPAAAEAVAPVAPKKEETNAVREPSAAPVPVREAPQGGEGVRKQDAAKRKPSGKKVAAEEGNAAPVEKAVAPKKAGRPKVEKIPAVEPAERTGSLEQNISKDAYKHAAPTTFSDSGPASRTAEEAKKAGGRIEADWWGDLAWAVRTAKNENPQTEKGVKQLALANNILDNGKVRDQDIAIAERKAAQIVEGQSISESKALKQREKVAPRAAALKKATAQQFKDEAANAAAEKAAAEKAKKAAEPVAKNRKERRALTGKTKPTIQEIIGEWVGEDTTSEWDGKDMMSHEEFNQMTEGVLDRMGFESGVQTAMERVMVNGSTTLEQAADAAAKGAEDPTTRDLAKTLRTAFLMAGAGNVAVKVVPHDKANVKPVDQGAYAPADDRIELYDAMDAWDDARAALHGVNAWTILHEGSHAATTWNMMRALKIAYGLSHGEIQKIVNSTKPSDIRVKVDAALGNSRLSESDRQLLRAMSTLLKVHQAVVDADVHGAFKTQLYNMKEFVAEALTNRNFQTWLKSVKLADGIQAEATAIGRIKTMWDGIVEAIRAILGVPRGSNSALSAVLDLTPTFMRKPGDSWGSVASNRRLSNINNGIGAVVDALSATGKDMNEFDRALASVPYRKLLTLKDKTIKGLLSAMSMKGIVFQFGRRSSALQQHANAVDAVRNEATSRNNVSSMLINHLRKWVDKNGGWSPQDADSSKPAAIIFRLMEQSTLLNQDPTKPIEQQADFVPASAHGRTGDKWGAFAKDYQTVTNLYSQLDGEGKKIYRDMKDHNRKMYDDLYEQMVHNIIRTMGDVKEQQGVPIATLAKNVREGIYGKDAQAAFLQLERDHARVVGPYFHLGRYGDYSIRYGTQEKHAFETFEDYGEFAARVAELKKQGKHLGEDGKQNETWLAGKMSEHVAQLDMGSWKFVRSMIEKIDGHPDLDETQRETMKHAVRQMYLQMLPETSSRKVFAKRKGIAGWDRDMMRNFAKRAEIANYNLAQAKHAVDVSDSIGAIKKQVTELEHTNPKEAVMLRHIEDEIRLRQSESMRTPMTPVVDKINALTYNFYLAFSPAYILTNLLQPWHMTLPMVGSKFGMTKTAIEMARNSRVAFSAIKQMWKQDWKYPDIAVDKVDGLSVDQKAFLKSAVASGRIDITLAHELGEVKKQGGVSKLNDWQHVFGLGSHYSEVMNRVTAGLTAFNLAKQSGMELSKAIEYGNRIVDETQYDYSSQNLARMMGKQGVAGTITPLFMAFQRYNAQTLELVTRLVQNSLGIGEGKMTPTAERAEARRALAGLVTITGAFAGMLGLPFANMVFALLDKMFGSDDEPLDSKSEFRNALAGLFGKDMGEIIAHGGPRALNVNMDRMGLADLLPFTKLMADKRKLKDMIEANAVDTMGPAMGGVTNMLLGANQIANGDTGAGLAKLFPIALGRNISKAAEIANGYAVDAKGNQIPIDLNSWDVFNQALGLTPTKLAERSEAQFAINNQDRQLQQAAQQMRTSTFRAMERGDQERVAELQRKMLEFNQRHPMYAITGIGRGYAQHQREKAVAATMGPGVGVRTMKGLPKLDIGGFANVRDEE